MNPLLEAVLPTDDRLQAAAYPVARVDAMATAPSEPLPLRLAAIREQLKLLSDYL
jgi:hypothetical protein